MNMFLLSIRRRKKEIRYVSVVTFIAVFFLSGIMLLQDIMNRFVMEQSYQNYGGWTISSVDEPLSHPYFAEEGKCETLTRLNDEALFRYLDAYVGTVDDILLKMGNIRLYEGRMPENKNEIVMDMPSLSAMGYSYDIGQEIKLYWQVQVEEDGILETVLMEKEYKLVGILHSFAAAWQSAEQKYLPGVLVMEEEAKYFPKLHTTWYYSLKKQYQGIDAVEFYDGIKENCAKPENVVYNSYVHTEQLWGSENAFRYVEYVMIAIAVSSMGFLLASYTARRRKVYYQYRCMGARIWQVRKMILTECLYATLPAVGLGIALAYGIAFAGSKVAATTMQMSDFFAFDAGVFGRQLAAIGIVLVCSISWTALQIRDKRLVQGKQEVLVKKLNRLRKRAVKIKHPQKDFLNRYNKLHPFSRAMFILFSVLVTGVLVLCGNQLNHNLTYRYAQYQEMIDFILEAEDSFKVDTFIDGNNQCHILRLIHLWIGMLGREAKKSFWFGVILQV